MQHAVASQRSGVHGGCSLVLLAGGAVTVGGVRRRTATGVVLDL
ncbi:MAG: hypothetical protein ACPLPR_01305 [Bacillota bacterium]